MDNFHYITVVLSAIILVTQIINIKAQDAEFNGHLLAPYEGCGISNVTNTKIVGGTEAKPGAFPWIALIGYKVNVGGELYDHFYCGGTLITSRHVLTAAHCHKTTKQLFVRLGEHEITTTHNGEHLDVRVSRTFLHPEFNTVTYDIAVFKLESDVEFNDMIRPICLPLSIKLQTRSYVGTNPFVAGWGYSEENGELSDLLMQLQLPVLENEVCEKEFSKKGEVYSRNQFDEFVLCAGNMGGGQDVCHGDSGGPMMLPILEFGEFITYQIGLVSYGVGCGRPNSPGVFTNVVYFVDWIKQQIVK